MPSSKQFIFEFERSAKSAHALCRLADKINRNAFEQAFSLLYSSDKEVKVIAGCLVREL